MDLSLNVVLEHGPNVFAYLDGLMNDQIVGTEKPICDSYAFSFKNLFNIEDINIFTSIMTY